MATSKGEQDALDAIAAMEQPDRDIATGLHELVARVAPDLSARTWYGFPAYAAGKKVVCFLTSRAKGGARYAVLGFNDAAQLDDGAMWPTSWAITEWSSAVEQQVEQLLRRAVPTTD